MEKEIWKDIPGYEGYYQVSTLGNIKALQKKYYICNSSLVYKDEKIMKQKTNRGYKIIELNKNGKSKRFQVHRLVALTFIPNIENKPYIDHIDGCRINNKLENLRWVTHKENMNNPITINRIRKIKRKKGCENPLYQEKSPCSKPVLQYDLQGNLIGRYTCVHEAARKLGLLVSNIARVCRNERKTYKNYLWSYE